MMQESIGITFYGVVKTTEQKCPESVAYYNTRPGYETSLLYSLQAHARLLLSTV